MSRKKRNIQEYETPVADQKNKPVYRDSFQQNVGTKIEDMGRKFEGKGRNVLYGLAAVAVLVSLIGIFYLWNRRADAAGQTALGKAIEVMKTEVTSVEPPAGSTKKIFKTEKERAEAAIQAFQDVADKHGSPVREKAKYFIAVNRLLIDRPAAIAELQELKGVNGEVGTLSKFALAQALTDERKLDEAAALYQELAAMSDPILSKDTINFNLAEIYRKQGKIPEASELYFNIAKAGSEIKDADGLNLPPSETAKLSREKLEEINPDKAREVPKPLPDGEKADRFVF
jgi:tetratricopeptide (TPR) repeat protein